jgi:anaerobic selenocysteine-containing dehydrogenase
MTDRVVSTTCPLDCPDACALEVTVSNGTIERIGGGTAHPDTAGFICTKVTRFDRRVYHARRLHHPLRRVGPKGAAAFERISWAEAMAEIVRQVRRIAAEWGGEAILPYHYGGSNGLLSDGMLDDLFFARLGASRLARTLCAAPSAAVATGMYGKMPGVAFEDYAHARCIVIWGANPKTSNIHLVPYLRAAKRRGAFIAVIDPRRNFSDNEADLHLSVYPGADLPLALAMIKLWHEEGQLDFTFLEEHCVGLDHLLTSADAWSLDRAAGAARVPAADIERLARVYANSNPAVVRCGWGLERNRNGGRAIAAILAMPALLGKFGVRGGGYTLSNSGALPFDADRLIDRPVWDTRLLNMTELGSILCGEPDPPVKGLFVYNCNPAVTVPDQNAVVRGLAREDLFTVVLDQVMTDTAMYGDVLLPATTFLEHWDIRAGYGAYVVGGIRPAIEPEGEAKSNHEVFAELGRAMGFDDEAFGWDQETTLQKAAEALRLGDGAAATLVSNGRAVPLRFDGATTPIMFENAFPATADGKVHLTPPQLGTHPYAYESESTEQYPFALVSPATSKTISSTLGEFNLEELFVEVHPQDAERLGITEDAEVRVFNDLGEVHCRARVRSTVRPGVVFIPKGAWRHSSGNGQTATALCPATVNDVAGGACFNDARVALERVPLR